MPRTVTGHRRTVPFTAPAVMAPEDACALCGSSGVAALNVPVFTPAMPPRVRRVCESCLTPLLGAVFQLLGHAPARLAETAVRMQDTGHS